MDTTKKMQFEQLATQIGLHASEHDAKISWPEYALQALSDARAWAWVIDREFGGSLLEHVDQLRAYEAVARGSVAVALILTQRDGAVQHLAASEQVVLKADLLPQYARNKRFTSVGISQLTTSRGRDGLPHMTATPTSSGGYILDGVMPWVTGAAYCDDLVTGGVLADGKQVLLHVSLDQPGFHVEQPMQLMALSSTFTTRVICEQVEVPPEHVLVEPTDAAVRPNAPVKPLIVASVGIGLAGSMVAVLEEFRPQLNQALLASVDTLIDEYHIVRARIYSEAERVLTDDDYVIPKAEVRIAVNTLLSRLGAALLLTTKGSGFMKGQPAERLAREAMFFHVWSAPDAVRAGTLGALI